MIEVPFNIIAGVSLVMGIVIIAFGLLKSRATITIVGIIVCLGALVFAICDNNIPYITTSTYLRTDQQTSNTQIEPWYHDDGDFVTIKRDGRLIAYPSRLTAILSSGNEPPHCTITMSQQTYGIKLGKLILTAKNSATVTNIDIFLPENIIPSETPHP